jgi:hypothetical protein
MKIEKKKIKSIFKPFPIKELLNKICIQVKYNDDDNEGTSINDTAIFDEKLSKQCFGRTDQSTVKSIEK